ncbi:hypothetical protein UFOVP112_240 [uncultured Caudovirales phage]|uniref:Uncharacterized protein n=1 Tax=uncultured Caudovirales phage TaxID=2100421 RepID=A0A6J5L6H1_9CAUD|nr:hypothetical protein UFOVP112_240 [uncultured Caudovirales phage]
MSEDKLNIKNEMAKFDQKDRGFYDSLTEEERKKFAPFLMIRWGSSVNGPAPVQEYYVMSCNERLNKNFFEINSTQHKKLQWLVATTVSPGIGNQYHQWIKLGKKDSDNKSMKFLRALHPELKETDIKLLAELNDKDDLKRMAKELGWDDKRIKSDL